MSARIIFSVFLLLSAACMHDDDGGGGGETAPGDEAGGEDMSGGEVMLEPNFDSIQENVFTPICTECHQGSSPPQGLKLSQGESYALLVDVPSEEVPEFDRVEPGDPGNSYLIQKLEGTNSVGEQMPLGGPYLDQAEIDVIRQWISDGAVRGTSSLQRQQANDSFSVVSISPPGNSVLKQAPGHVVITFNRALDFSRVDRRYFDIEASGGDGGFDDGNERRLRLDSVELSNRNPYAVVLKTGGADFRPDRYRIRLRAHEGTGIQDLQANRLSVEPVVSTFTLVNGDGE